VPESKQKFDKEGLSNVLFVAISVCLVCSVVVSSAAVVLKPRQILNEEFDKKQNILRAAGMLPQGARRRAGRTVEELFSQFEVRAVDLRTGEFTDEVDPADYDPIRASKVSATSTNLTSSRTSPPSADASTFSEVYIRRDEGRHRQGGAAGARLRPVGHAVRLSRAGGRPARRWPGSGSTATRRRPVSAARWTTPTGRPSGPACASIDETGRAGGPPGEEPLGPSRAPRRITRWTRCPAPR
jgi:hypothetical protein